MRKIIILLIFLSLLFVSSFVANANGYYDGLMEGERAAEREHTTTTYWLIGTPAAFLFTPLLGGGATIVTSYVTSPGPDSRQLARLENEDYSTEYIRGFEDGYKDVAQSKNTRAAWGATGVAFAARLVIILSADTYTYFDDSFSPSQVPIVSFEF